MSVAWDEIFEAWGVKTVAPNDKEKHAYYVAKRQLKAVERAGRSPSEERPAVPFPITLLFERRDSVQATFYLSFRNEGRISEPRLGTEFISDWLEVGDQVLIGNIGAQLFAAKIAALKGTMIDAAGEVGRKATPASRDILIARASLARGKPAKKVVTRNDYVRSAAVVMGAIARANGACEMPRCQTPLFRRDDGSPFLEVHHVQPLGEEGDDTLVNAAALCPLCHRELHFGQNRIIRRELLAERIRKISQ